jgi:formate hydrogenlyase transcriptional activator
VSAGTRANDDEITALRAIVDGTACGTGEIFFESLVEHLASAVGVGYAFVGEFAGTTTRVRTIAYWGPEGLRPNVEYDLYGTPCEDVVRGSLCHYPSGVKEMFPLDQEVVDLGVESYLGVPLLDRDGNVLGHLAVFDGRPMPAEPRLLFIFRIFATRAAVELERLRVEKQLIESERRYRDLYEEAPNAYVSLGRELRLINVNRRATQLLGYSAAELVGSNISRYFAETPSVRSKAEQAFAQGSNGAEVSGLELEMRRRDGGQLWVSLWMRPKRGVDGGIQAIHSIWVDVTDRVLSEAERARLSEQNSYLQQEIKSVHNFEEIVGSSPALLAVLDKVHGVAPTDATVLIQGETGTGNPRHPFHKPARGQALDQDQLRNAARWTCRERTVRPRERRIHWRDRPSHRSIRACRRRHDLSRRDRRAFRRDPGQAASRPAGARIRPGRWYFPQKSRRAGHRGH